MQLLFSFFLSSHSFSVFEHSSSKFDLFSAISKNVSVKVIELLLARMLSRQNMVLLKLSTEIFDTNISILF